MKNMLKSVAFPIKSISNFYNKMSVWGKLLILIIICLVVFMMFKKKHNINMNIEGFESGEKFLHYTGHEIYDDFYSDIYDHLVYNSIKDSYEVGQIINKTAPTNESVILDIGCGNGHHVAELTNKNLNAIGVDVSPAMVKTAKNTYPSNNYRVGDALNNALFQPSTFTHILCLYFTVYYIEDKKRFFTNCMKWLKQGGVLVVHLVDRQNFDPILNPANPLIILSPQRYAEDRITKSTITFDNFKYDADFKLDEKNDTAKFVEKFNFSDGKTRKNEHIMYMESESTILNLAQEAGFILTGKIDLIHSGYEYQYLYILQK